MKTYQRKRTGVRATNEEFRNDSGRVSDIVESREQRKTVVAKKGVVFQ
jgi:hypothetical protein